MDTNWNSTGHDPGEAVEYDVASRIQQALEDGNPASGVMKVTPRKHPRLRAWTGVLALLLGFALTAGSVCAGLEQWVGGSDLAWWNADWRETDAFRREVSRYLEEFLTLGAGGTLEWYETALENGDTWTSGGWWWDTASETAAAMEDTGDAAPDDAFRWDKNVLYRVVGKPEGTLTSYANTDAAALASFSALPEGYGFYLEFRNGRARAWLDGEELDLYGDGIYREGDGWYLPGYENFPAGEDAEGVAVQLAVRTEPIPYLQGQYGSGYVEGGSPMYAVYQGLQAARQFFFTAACCLAAGAALLILARCLKRDRQAAEARIAQWTVHVWTEARLLLAAACLLFLLLGYTDQGRPIWLVFSFLSNVGDLSPGTLAREYLPAALSMARETLPGLLTLCLVLWLIHNDHRHNPREQRRGAVRGLLRVLRDSQMKLPVQKRLRRWALARPIGLVVLAALFPAGVAFLDNIFWDFWFAAGLTFIILLTLGLVWLGFDTRRQLALARDIGLLADRISAARAGQLDTAGALPADGDLRGIAEDLQHIQTGLQQALEERTRSERMKVELISNVSHDLKTPLTSILSYAELLRQEPLEGAAADYARIIDEKAQRLKVMVQDVFEVSKAAADQLPVTPERLDFGKLLRQTLADMADPIAQSGLTFRLDLPEGEVPITADGRHLYRVFQNLIQNALQYALEGSRVYLTLSAEGGRAEAVIRNTSRTEIPAGVDFTARFVRGDASRTDGGSGLGLSIAKSFTEACGGAFRVETVADLFTAAVSFPLAGDAAKSA